MRGLCGFPSGNRLRFSSARCPRFVAPSASARGDSGFRTSGNAFTFRTDGSMATFSLMRASRARIDELVGRRNSPEQIVCCQGLFGGVIEA